MSKIQDALNKVARRGDGRALTLVQGVQPRLVNRSALKVLSEPSKHVFRPGARDEIARMRDKWLLGRDEIADARIIHPEMADSTVANAYRDLRAQIIRNSQISGNAVVMVTSVMAGAGSSFTARNLAAAFAFDDSRTALLVDCNLRNPSAQGGATEQGYGLTDYVERDEVSIDNIIRGVGIPRMRIISAGSRRENPAEYFSSDRLQLLIQELKNRYPDRFIILDSPPATMSADTRILSEVSDYVLMVVPYGRVTEAQLQTAVGTIEEGKLLGVVFNDEPDLPVAATRGPLSFIRSLIRAHPMQTGRGK